MAKPTTIAIDGPAACGKTTIGKLLAEKLGYRFVDTGAWYRALTWEALRLGVDVEDEAALGNLAVAVKIELATDKEDGIVVNGRYINEELRTSEVDFGVSPVAKVAAVRQVMVRQQQHIAEGGRVVMVGRDIGTNVLLDAGLKVYLDVSVEEQARRRYLEIIDGGGKAVYDDILAGLVRRDKIDSKRAVNPLKKADDAYLIHTDKLGIREVLGEILKLMDKR